MLAANHLQQAAEKILGAVRLHRGLLNTKDHDLVILIDGRPGGEPRALPAGDPWRERVRPLEPLHEELAQDLDDIAAIARWAKKTGTKRMTFDINW